MCGEQNSLLYYRIALAGSPPRVRGTGSKNMSKALAFRITPACAGNRNTTNLASQLAEDHPRVCGEQVPRPHLRGVLKGSPPRVRGTVCAYRSPSKAKGITPACAGNRLQVICNAKEEKDHPRVCGEQMYAAMFGHWPGGSPPRVRGTGRQAPMPSILTRITPACAGNRAQPSGSSRTMGDHPRVCGEQWPRAWSSCDM